MFKRWLALKKGYITIQWISIIEGNQLRYPLDSLRNRRLAVVDEIETGALERDSLLLVRPFFLEPTTSKRLLRRVSIRQRFIQWIALPLSTTGPR